MPTNEAVLNHLRMACCRQILWSRRPPLFNSLLNCGMIEIRRVPPKVPGKVTVLGYTDNVPIRSRQLASNDALSQERAMQVMQMLQAAGVPASRLEALGKGEALPVGDNKTVQGRVQNRRVEISVAE
ncbi:putative lipoprotein YiaD [Paraburkholderia domus]|uniref:Lipoprotein YiaD n=1 Tax=Paraburkholderia domus TaxID=2793075 RepID=A0A9N8N1G7_9BURK|nr:putative lipoprotein YiaD [Paraburkholderia domus]